MKILIQTLYTFLILILFYTSAYGTAQDPEIVFYNDQVYSLYAIEPLESYYRDRNNRPHFQIRPDGISTGNARGYIGSWEIRDKKLYLIGIDGWIIKDTGWIKADPETLFGDRYTDDRVAATWFTGDLLLKGGEMIVWSMTVGYEDIYEWEIVLKIETGNILYEETIDNRKDARLLDAAMNGRLLDLMTALDNGADINTKKICLLYGQTPLMAASDGSHTDVVKFLLGKGADVSARDKDGNTALMRTVSEISRAELLSGLEKYDSNADYISERMAQYDEDERVRSYIVKLLLDNGSDIDAKNFYGETALIISSESGQKEIVKILLEKGADVNAKDNNNDNALSLAKRGAYTEIVQMLEKAGAKE